MSAEGGYAHTILYPRFDVVIPEPQIRGQLAIALLEADAEWQAFLSNWLGLKEADGTIPRLYDKWIAGKGAREAKPRWCIACDVLQWLD